MQGRGGNVGTMTIWNRAAKGTTVVIKYQKALILLGNHNIWNRMPDSEALRAIRGICQNEKAHVCKLSLTLHVQGALLKTSRDPAIARATVYPNNSLFHAATCTFEGMAQEKLSTSAAD